MRPAARRGMRSEGRGTSRRRPQGRAVIARCVQLVWLIALSSFLFPNASHAQVRVVEILGADFTETTVDSAGTVRRLVGNVRLRQDTTWLRSRAAVYYESRGEVVLDGDVEVRSGQDTLTAAAVTYNSNTKVAVAEGAVRLGDGESVLLAPRATYDSRAEVASFEGGGRVLHRGAVLTAPSGTYSSARRFAEFAGPVGLEDSTGTLTAARGTYDARVRRADFAGDVRLRRPDAELDADSVVYFRRTERARAYGRVVLQRIGEGGDADAPADSTRRTFLFGETLLYDGQAETASARGDDRLDPLLLVLRADSTGRVDTTLARAPRIDAERLVVGADTSTVVVAAGGARLWERRLAAVADSARFVRSLRPPPPAAARPPLADSLGVAEGGLPDDPSSGAASDGTGDRVDRLVLLGARRPSVWADGAQLTGDSLRATTRDGAVDSLVVVGRAFAARLDSTLGRLQQIAGGRMRAAFIGDALDRLAVWPNAQALYFRATADGLLGGADEISADSLSFRFADGDLREITGYRGIEGTTYGPTIVPDTRLPGFAYDASGAPTRAGLLGDGWEVGWLERYGPPPESLAPPAGAAPPPADEADGPLPVRR